MYEDRDRGRIIEVLNPYTMETYKAIYMMGLLGTDKVVVVALDTHDGHVEYPELRMRSLSDRRHGLTYYANPFDGLDIIWVRRIMNYTHDFISPEEYNYVMMHVIRCIEGDNYTYDEKNNCYKNSDLCHSRYGTSTPADAPEDKVEPHEGDDIIARITKPSVNPFNPFDMTGKCSHFDCITGRPTVNFAFDGTIVCTSCATILTEDEMVNLICTKNANLPHLRRDSIVTEMLKKRDKKTGPKIDPVKCRHVYQRTRFTSIEIDEDQNMHCLQCGKTFYTADIVQKCFHDLLPHDPTTCAHIRDVSGNHSIIKLSDGTLVCALCGTVIASPLDNDSTDIDAIIGIISNGKGVPTEGQPVDNFIKEYTENPIEEVIEVVPEEEPTEEPIEKRTYKPDNKPTNPRRNKYHLDAENDAKIIKARLNNFVPNTKGLSVANIIRQYMEEFPEYVFHGEYFCLTRLYNLNRGYTKKYHFFAPAKYMVDTYALGRIPTFCLTPDEYEIMYKFSTHDLLEYDFGKGRHYNQPALSLIKSALMWAINGYKKINRSQQFSVSARIINDGKKFAMSDEPIPSAEEYAQTILKDFPNASKNSVKNLYYKYITRSKLCMGQNKFTIPEKVNKFILSNLFTMLANTEDKDDIYHIIQTVDGKYDAVIDCSLDLSSISNNQIAVLMATYIILKSGYASSNEKVVLHPAMKSFITYIGKNYIMPDKFVNRLYIKKGYGYKQKNDIKRSVFAADSSMFGLHQCMVLMYHMSHATILMQLKGCIEMKDYRGFANAIAACKGIRVEFLFGNRTPTMIGVLCHNLGISKEAFEEFRKVGSEMYPVPYGNEQYLKDRWKKAQEAAKSGG